MTGIIAVSAAVLVIIGCVLFSLLIPGETTSLPLVCGKEEHTHDISCYEDITVWTCTLSEGHVHQESCYEPQQIVSCGLEERDAHFHTDACYSQQEVIVCGKEETPAHTHSDSCCEQEEVLSCTQEETTGHAHTDACYESVLICGNTESETHVHSRDCYESHLVCDIKEGEGSHSHTAECYTAESVLICEQQETEGHTHDVSCIGLEQALTCGEDEHEAHIHDTACYTTESVAVCGQEELHVHTEGDCFEIRHAICCGEDEQNGHVHSEECFDPECLICTIDPHTHSTECYGEESDEYADLESSAVWEASVANVSLTGEWAADFIAIAESQLGYTESTQNFVYAEDGSKKGYTRYGAWYGAPYGDWCAMFVAFCLEYADIPTTDFPRDAACDFWAEELQSWGLYQNASTYTPEPGDLIFYNWDEDPYAEHIGIVTDISRETVTAIEGNSSNCVQYNSYSIYDDCILGYGTLPARAINCGLTVHEHEGTCYENEVLICGVHEHTHTDMCRVADNVRSVILLMDQIPDYETVDRTLLSYEENEDWTAYEEYRCYVAVICQAAYTAITGLSEDDRALVFNSSNLWDLEWLWSAVTLAASDTITVYHLNHFDSSATGYAITDTTLIYGGTVGDILSSDQAEFAYWTAVTVEDVNGVFTVTEIRTDTESKRDCGAASEGGFVLLVHVSNGTVAAEVGDAAIVSFDLSGSGYEYYGYGTVTFEAVPELKPAKDNSGELTVVGSTSTAGTVEINLFDYDDNINELYDQSSSYPGFQQDEGVKAVGNAFSYSNFNFGNNITSDLNAGHSYITSSSGATVNTTTGYSGGVNYGTANVAVAGAMSMTLTNGYPALANGISLEYLFTDSMYAEKLNTQSIDGLFRKNAVTGMYEFNSRETHAQYNYGSDTFTLYAEHLTANTMMYPFGNFLPLNDIVSQAKRSSDIDRAYLLEIAESAEYKQLSGYSSHIVGDSGTTPNEYGNLSDMLTDFIALMDSKYGVNWTMADCTNAYFGVSGLSTGFTAASLSDVYCIDYDEPTDFYFGLEIKMDFMQPRAGLTGNDNGDNTEGIWAVDDAGNEYLTGSPDGISDYPMKFEFSGDDDVWVYIDGVLFLDLSGIHRHVGGEIDFQNGVVNYYPLSVSTGDCSSTPYKTVTFAEILTAAGKTTDDLNSDGTFIDYSSHTFQMYYMERGSGSGVCRINFNFPLLQTNTISVAKELTIDTGSLDDILGEPEFRFQVLKANADGTKTTDLLVGGKESYAVYDSTNTLVNTAVTDENGVFTLLPGQRAVFVNVALASGKYYVRELMSEAFVEQYGNISVDGTSVTTNLGVMIGEDSFAGLDSAVKDIGEGSTVFTFNNQISAEKLGALEIKKVLDTADQGNAETEFAMEVLLDDVQIPVGTAYIVDGEQRTVEEPGIVYVPAGGASVITDILAGTAFTVTETSGSSDGYTVVYSGSEGVTVTETEVSGLVSVNSTGVSDTTTVSVTVTNAEDRKVLQIPVVKTVTGMDNLPHTYEFVLEQVADSSGAVLVTDGATDKVSVSYADGEPLQDSTAFERVYTPSDAGNTYYYRITEVIDEEDLSTAYDDTVYVVGVTVTTDTAGMVDAEITGLWRDGEEQAAEDPITFENSLVTQIVLTKFLQGPETGEKFIFTILLSDADNLPVTGTFGDVEFDETGSATVELAANESIAVVGIPSGTVWSVTEENAGAYTVVYAVGDSVGAGIKADGIITAGTTYVSFTNSVGYDLPDAGGAGANAVLTIGGILVAFVVAIFITKRRLRGR